MWQCVSNKDKDFRYYINFRGFALLNFRIFSYILLSVIQYQTIHLAAGGNQLKRDMRSGECVNLVQNDSNIMKSWSAVIVRRCLHDNSFSKNLKAFTLFRVSVYTTGPRTTCNLTLQRCSDSVSVSSGENLL